MEHILIIGSNGLLGQTLINQLCHSNYKVFALSKGANRNVHNKNYTYLEVDITDETRLLQAINKAKPNYIINAAALTNVDYCETHQLECDAVNVKAVKTLIKGAQLSQAHLIHISTDFVFDGTKGNYKEEDATNPLNYYGLSKLKSENLFKEVDIPFTILRTILVFGYVPELKQQNILLWLLDKMKNKIALTMVNDQIRTPTYVDDLAKACLLSIKTKSYGLYHISGTDLMDMFELSNRVAKTFKFNQKLISAIPTSQLNQPATRPKVTGFDISKAEKYLNFKPLSFTDALLEIKAKLNSKNC